MSGTREPSHYVCTAPGNHPGRRPQINIFVCDEQFGQGLARFANEAKSLRSAEVGRRESRESSPLRLPSNYEFESGPSLSERLLERATHALKAESYDVLIDGAETWPDCDWSGRHTIGRLTALIVDGIHLTPDGRLRFGIRSLLADEGRRCASQRDNDRQLG